MVAAEGSGYGIHVGREARFHELVGLWSEDRAQFVSSFLFGHGCDSPLVYVPVGPVIEYRKPRVASTWRRPYEPRHAKIYLLRRLGLLTFVELYKNSCTLLGLWP